MTRLNENNRTSTAHFHNFDMKQVNAFMRTQPMGGFFSYIKWILSCIPGSLSQKKKYYQVFDRNQDCIDPEMLDFYTYVYKDLDMSTHIEDRHKMSQDVSMLRSDLKTSIKKYKEEHHIAYGKTEQNH